MYRLWNDLRILRLATNLEETFERYEAGLLELVPEATVRAKLAPLFEEGPAHRLLRGYYKELSKTVQDLEGDAETADVLQTLRDCEAGAHDFYIHYLDRLSDPRLVKLFKAMADEERKHLRIVEEAISSLPVRIHREAGVVEAP